MRMFAAALSVLLLAGCAGGKGAPAGAGDMPAKARDAAELAADQPKAAQQPRPGSEPLFHATSATGHDMHELDVTGGFTVRFACKGTGSAVVSLGPSTKYRYACT